MSTFPIIRKLGGKDAAFDKIKAQGFSKGPDALRMWHARQRMPGDAITLFMKVAEEEGVPYEASDFEFVDQSAPSPEPAHG